MSTLDTHEVLGHWVACVAARCGVHDARVDVRTLLCRADGIKDEHMWSWPCTSSPTNLGSAEVNVLVVDGLPQLIANYLVSALTALLA